MKPIKTLHLLFIGLLFLCALPARAQILSALLNNLEVGYNAPWAWADNMHSAKGFQPGNNKPFDTTVTRQVHSLFGTRSKMSLGVSAGTSIPITRLGRKSQLAFSLGFIYNMYYWGHDMASYGPADVTDSGIHFMYDNSKAGLVRDKGWK